jgi:hypothetical protein
MTLLQPRVEMVALVVVEAPLPLTMQEELEIRRLPLLRKAVMVEMVLVVALATQEVLAVVELQP